MAGSFDVFRKYQRGLLVCVAILAMLAFFVLPPILQMGMDSGAADPVVATWRGGGIREAEMQRALAMRIVLNQFLRDAIAATGRDPGDLRVLGEDEADVVRTLLLAREAEANGIVIGNGAVNQFLAEWTNNMVRPEQFEAIIAGRRMGRMPVSTADVFDALRTILAADRMRQLSFAGFVGDPPAARWDIFRRLEQEATIEVVPVVVESFAGDVPAPAEDVLRAFFDGHKDALPVDRSPDPGFKEPHRISYDWIVANRESLEAAAAKDVTDVEIEKFYEENKKSLYMAKPKAAPARPDGADESAQGKPDGAGVSGKAEPEAADETEGQAPRSPAAEKPAAEEPAAEEPVDEPATGEPKAMMPGRSRIVAARFRKAEGDTAPPAADLPVVDKAPADKPAADKPDADKPVAPAQPAAGAATGSEGFEPLDKVRDDVRQRLASAAVARRVDGVFQAIGADVAGFSRDLSRWKAENGGDGSKPEPPNADAIAERQGLQGGHAVKRTAGESIQAGGVGATFQVALDPSSPMGFRQAQWADLFYRMERPLWRPVETRDIAGDRYLTWKTEDFPAFVPEFDAVRGDVERAWRIVEARPLARKVAEEITAAGGQSLADAVAGRSGPKFEAATVGPFTWLSRGGAPFGSPVSVSQPEGLEMPGEDFMRAVFALEPGGTAVAFNEPRTICYAIRLVSYTPAEDDLRKRFVDPKSDQRRVDAVAERDQARAFEAWLAGVEKRAGLEWNRPPQRR